MEPKKFTAPVTEKKVHTIKRKTKGKEDYPLARCIDLGSVRQKDWQAGDYMPGSFFLDESTETDATLRFYDGSKWLNIPLSAVINTGDIYVNSEEKFSVTRLIKNDLLIRFFDAKRKIISPVIAKDVPELDLLPFPGEPTAEDIQKLEAVVSEVISESPTNPVPEKTPTDLVVFSSHNTKEQVLYIPIVLGEAIEYFRELKAWGVMRLLMELQIRRDMAKGK